MTVSNVPIVRHPNLDDIRASGRLLGGVALRTATERSRALSALTGADVVLKMRGAYAALHALDPTQRARGIDATIVMPFGTPFGKVVLEGTSVADALAAALALAEREGSNFISGYDDPSIVAGAGTVALEMLEDAPDPTVAEGIAVKSIGALNERILAEYVDEIVRRTDRQVAHADARHPERLCEGRAHPTSPTS